LWDRRIKENYSIPDLVEVSSVDEMKQLILYRESRKELNTLSITIPAKLTTLDSIYNHLSYIGVDIRDVSVQRCTRHLVLGNKEILFEDDFWLIQSDLKRFNSVKSPQIMFVCSCGVKLPRDSSFLVSASCTSCTGSEN
jgi:hypothetical protein